MKTFFKIIGAAAVAFILLNAFCFLYSNVPPHAESTTGATDFVRPPHRFYSRWREGGSFGFTNNEGLYNLDDHEKGDRTDVLVMGSSHLEGTYTPIEYSVIGRLSEKLPDKKVYNIGMASHAFTVCANNLKAAIDTYKPTEYVALIMFPMFPTDDELRSAAAGNTPERVSFTEGALNVVENLPYARLLFDNWKDQVVSFLRQVLGGSKGVQKQPPALTDTERLEMMDIILEDMSRTAADGGVKLLLFYTPEITFDDEDNIVFDVSEDVVRDMAALCGKHGILFLDLSERFLSDYADKHVLPYGFWNTSVGIGHLNKDGCEMVADELAKMIAEGR